MRSFPDQFHNWLRKAMAGEVPPGVQAFAFNLYECAQEGNARFGVELVGAPHFDADDGDWACDEVWRPLQRRLDIPASFSGTGWEKCLAQVTALVNNVMEGGGRVAVTLKSRQAVAVGFVDGDLAVLWQS